MKQLFTIASCFATVATMLVSCGSNPRSSGDVVVISSENTKTYSDLGMIPDFVEDWDFIRLETSEKSLLMDARDCHIDDDLIFIKSTPTATGGVYYGVIQQEIKVFDKTGKYLYNIGSFGKGPQEYASMFFGGGWYLNRYEKYIDIYDNAGNRMVKYGYDGKFIEAIDVNGKLNSFSSLCFAPDGNSFIYKPLGGQADEEIVLLDKEFNAIDTLASLGSRFEEHDVLNTPYIANCISYNRKEVLMTKYYCDTVFTYNNGELYPAYYMDISRSIPDGFRFKPVYRNSNDLKDDLPNNFHDNAISKIYDIEKYCIFNCGGNYIVWDKKERKGIRFGKNTEVSTVPVPNIMWISIDDDRLVVGISALRLIEYKERLAEEGIELTPKLRALFDGLAEDDNPVLITYKLKSGGEMF